MTTADIAEALSRLREGFAQGRGALVLACGTPATVVWANAAAAALFGTAEPAALGAIVFPSRAGRGGPAATMPMPRFERVRFLRGGRTRAVSVAHLPLELASGRAVLAGAVPDYVLGAERDDWADSVLPPLPDGAPEEQGRGPAPTAEPGEALPGSIVDPSPPDDALRARLAAAPSNRFLWQTDAEDKATLLKGSCPDLFGVGDDRLLGQPLPAALAALGCDPTGSLAKAFATRATWSNLALHWPVGEGRYTVAATLGAIPLSGPGQAFKGYHGFAVADLTVLHPAPQQQAVPQATAPPSADDADHPAVAEHDVGETLSPAAWIPLPDAPPPVEPGSEAVEARAAENGASYSSKVVVLRPYHMTTTLSAAAIPATERASTEQDNQPKPPADLTPSERSALSEIALALSGRAPGEQFAAAAPSAVADDGVAALMDAVPSALLYREAEAAIRPNRAFRDRFGIEGSADLPALLGSDPFASPDGSGRLTLPSGAGGAVAVAYHTAHLVVAGRPLALLAVAPDVPGADATPPDRNALIDQVGQPLVLLEPTGRILRLNEAGEDLFGLKAKDVSGHDVAALLGADHHPAVVALLESSAFDRAASQPLTLTVRAADGRSLPLSLTARRIDGEHVLLTVTDHSEVAQRDAELTKVRSELGRVRDGKTDLVAKISHEIRTPLNAILGFAEVILDERFGPLGNPRYRDYVMDIHGSGSHVINLLTDLLDLSKTEAGRLELTIASVDVNKAVAEQVAQFQAQAHRERVIMRTSLQPRLPMALLDENALRQMLANVLSNAVKFNEPGGQVIVSTAVNDGGAIAVRIRDTGIGMSDDELETALEPFRQIETAKPQGGSGLGLPLTMALAEANGATATIRSRKAEGTLVELLLRADPAHALRVPA